MEMESSQNFPTASFKTGLKLEERRFTWTIDNFHVILLQDSLIDAQEIEFTAGASIGLDSKWSVDLSCDEEDGKKWAGIYFNLKERPALKSEFLFASCAFHVKDGKGQTTFNKATSVKDMYSEPLETGGWGFMFVERDGEEEDLETVTINITFKLFSPSVITPSVEAAVAQFGTESQMIGSEHMGLLQKPGSLTDIQLMSSDKKWFTAKKEILSARSPVFEAMLKANMREGKDGVVKISDLNSKALPVLLHYISVGELHEDWRENDVLVELTNAAAQYQLPELLHFLDGVMGKVCDVRNVGALLTLANRLSLKQAEADLLSFIRIKGTRSSEELFGILNAMMATREEEAAGSHVGGGSMAGGEMVSHPSSSANTNPLKRSGNEKDDEDPPTSKKRKHDK